MIGYGDFRGVYQEDLNSRCREIIRRIKCGYVSDPTMSGRILNQPGGRWHKFCCDTGCSTNLMPTRMAALNGLKWSPVDPDEPQYRSVTNQKLDVIGQTSCFVKLEKVKKPVKLSFIVVLEDGNEALVSLDTLKDLSIVSQNFPCPMDSTIRDHKAMRVVAEEQEDESYEQNEEEKKKFSLQERVDNLRQQLRSEKTNEKEWEEERKCEEMKKKWLEDYADIFKEDLSKEDRINICLLYTSPSPRDLP